MTIVRSGARTASPEDRFRGLFSAHYGSVHSYCARRLGRQDAPDAAADVFAVAWRKIRRVPVEPESLPWLYAVARHVVANHRRATNRRHRLDARLYAVADGPTGYEHPDDMAAVLNALRPDDREVLMLAAWEGLGPEDLGAALGCSPGAATVRLHRARARLATAWDQIHHGGVR